MKKEKIMSFFYWIFIFHCVGAVVFFSLMIFNAIIGPLTFFPWWISLILMIISAFLSIIWFKLADFFETLLEKVNELESRLEHIENGLDRD